MQELAQARETGVKLTRATPFFKKDIIKESMNSALEKLPKRSLVFCLVSGRPGCVHPRTQPPFETQKNWEK